MCAVRALLYGDTYEDTPALRKNHGVYCFQARLYDESIGLLCTEETGWIVLRYYKGRGCTDSLSKDLEPATLQDIDVLLAIAEQNGARWDNWVTGGSKREEW